MEELNEEAVLNELNKFVDVTPQANLYVPQYVRDRIEMFKPICQNAIKLLQSTLHCKYSHLHKYEFIEYENNKPYFNNEKFKEKLNDIFSKTSLSEEEKEEKINFYRQQLLCDTENFAMTDYNLAEYGLIITLDYNKNFILPEMTIFTELCYTFEKYRQNIIQPEYHFQNQHLQEIQQKSSEQVISDKNVLINIKTNVFAGLATLLNNIILLKNEDRKNVLHNVGSTILYLMSFQSRKNGFYAYHSLMHTFSWQIDNIIENCINEENQSVNYVALYKYVKESLRQKPETVKNATYETAQSILNHTRKRPKDDTKIIFGEVILSLTNETIPLEQCEKRLELIKTKISQDKSGILNKLAEDLVAKCKTNAENVK